MNEFRERLAVHNGKGARLSSLFPCGHNTSHTWTPSGGRKIKFTHTNNPYHPWDASGNGCRGVDRGAVVAALVAFTKVA